MTPYGKAVLEKGIPLEKTLLNLGMRLDEFSKYNKKGVTKPKLKIVVNGKEIKSTNIEHTTEETVDNVLKSIYGRTPFIGNDNTKEPLLKYQDIFADDTMEDQYMIPGMSEFTLIGELQVSPLNIGKRELFQEKGKQTIELISDLNVDELSAAIVNEEIKIETATEMEEIVTKVTETKKSENLTKKELKAKADEETKQKIKDDITRRMKYQKEVVNDFEEIGDIADHIRDFE
jgi:hypothetical protein